MAQPTLRKLNKMEKKAIFLGATKLHSNKTNKDYRKVDFYVPPYEKDGFIRGGVVTVFTPVDSTLGNDIKVGSVVIPTYDYDGVSQHAELADIKVVKTTPYTARDFE